MKSFTPSIPVCLSMLVAVAILCGCQSTPPVNPPLAEPDTAKDTPMAPAAEPAPVESVSTPVVDPVPATMPNAGEVLVTVEGETLTRGEVEKVVEQVASGAGEGDMTPDQIAYVRKEIVGTFVEQTLLAHEADRRGIAVAETDIDEEITKIQEGMVTDTTMEQALSEAGMTMEELRKNILTGLKINALAEQLSSAAQPVTEEEIKEFYDGIADPADARSLDDVREEISDYLQQMREYEAVTKLVDELKKSADIVYAPDAMPAADDNMDAPVMPVD